MEDSQKPAVDFSMQFNFAKNHEKIEQYIIESLKVIAKEIDNGKESAIGSIIVLGDFEKFGPIVEGMVQMKPKQNPVENLLVFDETQNCVAHIKEFSKTPFDGAIVVNRTGQIIGAGVYLVVSDPLLDTPDDCGTRHKAAASFSKRTDIISVLTLSEETNIIRVWQHGKIKIMIKTIDEEEEKKINQKRKNNKNTITKENEE